MSCPHRTSLIEAAVAAAIRTIDELLAARRRRRACRCPRKPDPDAASCDQESPR